MYSRAEWGEVLNVSPSAISLWLKDRTLPRPEILRCLLNELDQYESQEVREKVAQFRVLAEEPSDRISPLSRNLGPTLWHYLAQPALKQMTEDLHHIPGPQRFELIQALVDVVTRVAHLGEPVPQDICRGNRKDHLTLALVTDSLSGPVAAAWLAAMEAVCSPLSIHLLPLTISPGGSVSGVIRTWQDSADGFLVLSLQTMAGSDAVELERLLRQVPIVAIGVPLPAALPCVRTDHRAAGALAAAHLADQIHRLYPRPPELFIMGYLLDSGDPNL